MKPIHLTQAQLDEGRARTIRLIVNWVLLWLCLAGLIVGWALLGTTP